MIPIGQHPGIHPGFLLSRLVRVVSLFEQDERQLARIEAERRLFSVVGQRLDFLLQFRTGFRPSVELIRFLSFYFIVCVCVCVWLTHLIVGSRFIVVAHGDDGQHQVDEVKGAKKDDNHEEDDRVRPANGQHHVVNVLPIVERDQLKSGQHRPRKRVEIGVTKVGIIAQAGQTDVVARAVPVSTCQKRKKKKGTL